MSYQKTNCTEIVGGTRKRYNYEMINLFQTWSIYNHITPPNPNAPYFDVFSYYQPLRCVALSLTLWLHLTKINMKINVKIRDDVFKSSRARSLNHFAMPLHKIATLKKCFRRWSGKHPLARWQQSFSNASDPLVLPQAFLENELKIPLLLRALAVATASLVAVAMESSNYLKIELMSQNSIEYSFYYLITCPCQ